MRKVTREFAAACTNNELHCLLHILFNELADKARDRAQEHGCHSSIQAIRTELAHPSR